MKFRHGMQEWSYIEGHVEKMLASGLVAGSNGIFSTDLYVLVVHIGTAWVLELNTWVIYIFIRYYHYTVYVSI